MKMRSHMRSATFMSWVLNRMVVPCAADTSRIASRSTSAFTGSSPENGSSRMSRSGREMTAAMNWTFCAMPFESVSIGSIEPGAQGSFGQSTYLSQNR